MSTATNVSIEHEGQDRWWHIPDKILTLVGITGVLIEIFVLLAVTILCLYFQVIDRPKLVKSYCTNLANDTNRGRLNYVCACDLPTTLQKPENYGENFNGLTNATLDRCYEKNSLETVTILMFPNSTTSYYLSPVLEHFFSPDQVYYKTVAGYALGQEAHDLVRVSTSQKYPAIFNQLYPAGLINMGDILLPIGYVTGAQFQSFSDSYLRIAFSYLCKDCSSCNPTQINELLSRLAIDDQWAECFAWGKEDKCQESQDYEAKCLLYQTESIPAVFAMKSFFTLLVDQVKVNMNDIHPIDEPADSRYRDAYVSLQPKSLYVNMSLVEPRDIGLGFVEFAKNSPFWISLLRYFPNLGNNCTALEKVDVCNGTSFCNVFRTAKTANYDLKCFRASNRAECTDMTAELTVDRVRHLLPPEELKDGTANVRREDWEDIMCGSLEDRAPCVRDRVPPYLVQRNISTAMQKDMDALNQFLYQWHLRNEWAQISGICINTFENVVRHSLGEGKNRHDIYLETQCNMTQRVQYCWITGRYHNITDGPEDDWKVLDESDFPRPPDRKRFVCYSVVEKGLMTWTIFIVGIVFGWIGTVHLIFACLWSAFNKLPSWSETCCSIWRSRWWHPVDDSRTEDKPSFMEQEPGAYKHDPPLKSPVSNHMGNAVKRSKSMVMTSGGV